MSVAVASLATRARAALEAELAEAGIEATGDAGAFHPQPVGVLIGLPTLVSRGLAASTFTIPVLVVSGDPLSTAPQVDRAFALADEVAAALSTAAYRPTSYRSSSSAEPLPAIELIVTVTVSTEEA